MFVNYFRNILRPQQMFPRLLAETFASTTMFPRLPRPVMREHNIKKVRGEISLNKTLVLHHTLLRISAVIIYM